VTPLSNMSEVSIVGPSAVWKVSFGFGGEGHQPMLLPPLT
jgi:hypothetical protein